MSTLVWLLTSPRRLYGTLAAVVVVVMGTILIFAATGSEAPAPAPMATPTPVVAPSPLVADDPRRPAVEAVLAWIHSDTMAMSNPLRAQLSEVRAPRRMHITGSARIRQQVEGYALVEVPTSRGLVVVTMTDLGDEWSASSLRLV